MTSCTPGASRPSSGTVIVAGSASSQWTRSPGHHPTPGFTETSDTIITWSAAGTRLFVTAVGEGRDIGFARGDAPSFRPHLVHVAGDGYIVGSNSSFADFFVASSAGTGAVFNAITGTPAEPAAGPASS